MEKELKRYCMELEKQLHYVLLQFIQRAIRKAQIRGETNGK